MKKNKNKFSRDRFFVGGINCARELLSSSQFKIEVVDIQDGGRAVNHQDIKLKLKEPKFKLRNYKKTDFEKKYPGIRSQGIIIHFSGEILKNIKHINLNKPNNCLLALDGIEDPQNLGQIIRTAECAGIDGIILPKHRSIHLTQSVLQVSQGAFVHVPLFLAPNLNQSLISLKKAGFWTTGVENSIKAKSWHHVDFTGRVVIVIGSEKSGIKKLILKHCDFHATIPMLGKINSLNVSAAVSAILFERNRQLDLKKSN